MGTSTNAILAYGYNLGCDEDWELEGLGEYGEFTATWYDPDSDDGFAEQMQRHLLASLVGFTETYEDSPEGYFTREREAEEALGLEIVTYCSGEYPMHMLATCEITVYRGDVKEITAGTLATEPAWDPLLQRAIDALGIRPKQKVPGWLLCSYWG